MSLPLKDLGNLKVSERAHSYLRARALSKRIDLLALVRELVEAHVAEELHVISMANEIHKSKELGEIMEDEGGRQ